LEDLKGINSANKSAENIVWRYVLKRLKLIKCTP